MATLKSYMDNSSTEGRKPDDPNSWFCLAGLVLEDRYWEAIEGQWNRVLDKFGIRYSHMKEYAGSSPGTPFYKWSKIKPEPPERKAFLSELYDVVGKPEFGKKLICSVINLKDLHEACSDYEIQVSPYAVCLASCKYLLGSSYGGAQCIVDNFDGCSSLLADADVLLSLTSNYNHIPRSVVATPSPCPAHCMPGIQIADLIAWEVRRYWDSHSATNVERKEFSSRIPFHRIATETDHLSTRLGRAELDGWFNAYPDKPELQRRFPVKMK